MALDAFLAPGKQRYGIWDCSSLGVGAGTVHHPTFICDGGFDDSRCRLSWEGDTVRCIIHGPGGLGWRKSHNKPNR